MTKRIAAAAQPALLPPPVSHEENRSEGLKCWAVIELYGHARIVGAVTADPVELPGMIRIDVPDLLKNGEVVRKGHTRYIGKGAIYALNPCDETTVRNLLPHVDGLPARPMTLRGYRDDFE